MNRKRRHRNFRRGASLLSITDKATRVLHIVLVGFIIILARVWHLSVVQSEELSKEAARPRKRVVVVPAKRATIRDRFNIPLALNKVKYQAAVYYSHIREIPRVTWERNAKGKKEKHFRRKEYIAELSSLLGEELNLDPERIEDVIYSKAVFYNTLPYVIKEDISEKQYSRLKMLEKDWPGISAMCVPKRHYPKNRVASEVIGYMGSINKEEYEGIFQEISSLKETIQHIEEGEDIDNLPDPITYEEAVQRLRDLEEHAYALNDYVGKSGIEGKFEEDLRGYYGKKIYQMDAKGNYLRELPGARDPIPGNRLLLTISSELQEFAEELLVKTEQMREENEIEMNPSKKTATGVKAPWIRGGAIIAMDPETGEVLALAGYPRFDPNDFIPSGNSEWDQKKKEGINRWFEGDDYVGKLWDQIIPLQREEFDFQTDVLEEREEYLTWEHYLDFILPPEHRVRKTFDKNPFLVDIVSFQKHLESLITHSEIPNLPTLIDVLYNKEPHIPLVKEREKEEIEEMKAHLERNPTEVFLAKREVDEIFSLLPNNKDKIFFIDLCRLTVRHEFFSDDLIPYLQGQTLSKYRNTTSSFANIALIGKKMAKELYREYDFKPWREENEKGFLKKKREQEKERKTYARPYLDYLDRVEQDKFSTFWERERNDLLLTFLTGKRSGKQSLIPYEDYFLSWYREIEEGAHSALLWHRHYQSLQTSLNTFPSILAKEYLQSMRTFHELDRPLIGRYRNLRNRAGCSQEKHLAGAFYPRYGFGYARSHAFRQAAVQGSIFKLVTAYAGLYQKYLKGYRNVNPLEINDQVRRVGNKWQIGTFSNGKPIPRIYKGGRVPKSLSKNIGQTDIIVALERSSNPYFALLAGDHLEHPDDLLKAARLFSYGGKTGIALAGEYSGNLPDTFEHNQTNLYACSIGQGNMVVTPLQTAVMLSTIANGGKVLKPKIVKLGVGGNSKFWMETKEKAELFDYQKSLSFLGLDFPLFSLGKPDNRETTVHLVPTETKWSVDFPEKVRAHIMYGMRRAVNFVTPFRVSHFYRNFPQFVEQYKEIRPFLIGKTSSSESMEHLTLDQKKGVQKLTHMWFGGISFKDKLINDPMACVSCDAYGKPEIIVVVYLRYGTGGKDAIPIAANVVNKWREIIKNH